ncbi:c-type cytochrome [bacterium]|nr:c-type cytochrome [bacterium]
MQIRHMYTTARQRIQHLLPGVSVVALACLFSFASGCSDQGDPLSPTPPDTTSNQGEFDWVDNIGPLFQQRCIACHGASLQENGFDARTYADVFNYTTTAGNPLIDQGNPDGSELVARVEGDGFQRMPVGPALSTDQIAMIRDWISNGAPEDVPNDTTGGGNNGGTVAADSITWDNTVGRILNNNCLSCHNADLHYNDFQVVNFEMVFTHMTEDGRAAVDTAAVEESELLLRLEGNGVSLMPDGGPALAAELIDTVRTWIENGAPENDAFIGIGGGDIGEPGVGINWVESVGRILENNCAACHSGGAPQSGLDLTDYDELFDHTTAQNNDVIKEGDLEDSELYRRINGDGFAIMPPAGSPELSSAEIDTIRQWILDDAPFDGSENVERFPGQPILRNVQFTSR